MIARRLILGFGLTLVALLLHAAPVSAQRTPAKKDSPAFLFPKAVTLKAVVEPAEARPGQTVTYRVTATVDEPWHIYAYSKVQVEEGPRSTQFDLFETGGLTPLGDWTPDKPPTEKPEPAFDNKIYGSYEGLAVWSIRLQVPPNSPPDSRILQSQIYFQICDPIKCNPPVFRSLEPVTLTVAGDPLPASEVEPISPLVPESGDLALASATESVPSLSATADASSGGVTQNVAEQKISEGLIPFLLFSALGGLAALVMPCVWPMVPVTVNFFVKHGQKKEGNATQLAITYCLAIIAIFTLVGVLFSAFMGAASLQRLASTAWLNLLVAAIFIAFGLSLLGLFEIRLPNFLLNASAQGESRGGLVGVIFMALTLTITSFTCTFPVVGGLLVIASKGSYIYPVLGLATFATVLALPFFLMALAPSLIQRVPRSGDWMNTVKIVGGLVEIGAAFKFLNTAEIALGATPDSAWIDVQVVLSIWVVLAAVAGLYLLGMFRTDHDYGDAGVGPIRILSGVTFLFLALYFTPALFGFPPQSKLYNLFVGLMPPDVGELSASMRVGSSGENEVKATSKDPALAERQEKISHGVQWGMSYEQALETARESGRPILIDFTGVNCANCRQMEREVMPRPEISDLLSQFVTVAQYTDIVPISSISPDARLELASANSKRQYDLVRDVTTPLYVVLSPEGQVLGSRGGYIAAEEYQAFLEQFLKPADKTPAARP